ncbi:MAG: TetR/AcrR family transcriptional regulator [Eubacteriales bacterium]|nr:TetR/AcrR family transcriptional regulator [Eubacteriales bacterium]
MRTIKAPEARRNEILDAANALFSQKGFDDTSVNDILGAIGIAKGTFYYYFKSKEEVMDALVERCGARMFARAAAVAADASLGVHERIFYTMASLNMRETEGEALLETIHRPQNALMHEKSMRLLFTGAVPILAGIVEEGVAQGLFDTRYPEACAEMIIIYAQIAFDEAMLPAQSAWEERIAAFIANIERLLGAKQGSFAYVKNLFTGEDYEK